jgi:hypothetical protein
MKQQDQYFEVLQATAQEQFAGAPGGGRGMNYKLTVRLKTDSPVTFDSIWLPGKKLLIKPQKGGQDNDVKPGKNDVITLIASDFRSGPGRMGRREQEQRQTPSADSATAPIEYEGAALIKYTADGSVRYFTVSKITALPPVYGQ